MSYPSEQGVLDLFSLKENKSTGYLGKGSKDGSWLPRFISNDQQLWVICACFSLCVHEGLLQPSPVPSPHPSTSSGPDPLAGSEDCVHHLEWRLTAMSTGREQSDPHALSCMTGQQPSTAIKHGERRIFLDRFKFLALLWLDVLHCFPVVRRWHIPSSCSFLISFVLSWCAPSPNNTDISSTYFHGSRVEADTSVNTSEVVLISGKSVGFFMLYYFPDAWILA